jgi:thioredoxin 1
MKNAKELLEEFTAASAMAGRIKEFTDGNWKSEVLESPIPVVVDFWAPWCGPCGMLAPTIEKLAGEYEGKVKIGKMNTDENQVTPGNLRISAIPTVLVFYQGKEVDRLVGVNPATKFKASLDKLGGA